MSSELGQSALNIIKSIVEASALEEGATTVDEPSITAQIDLEVLGILADPSYDEHEVIERLMNNAL